VGGPRYHVRLDGIFGRRTIKRGSDDLGPLLRFTRDEGAEFAGRQQHRNAPRNGKTHPQAGISEAGIDLLVGRSVLGRSDAEPSVAFVAGHVLANGRDVWQRLKRSGLSHRKRTEPTSPYVLDRGKKADEHDLHLPAE
jgi:hypothetical protein